MGAVIINNDGISSRKNDSTLLMKKTATLHTKFIYFYSYYKQKIKTYHQSQVSHRVSNSVNLFASMESWREANHD